jgi:hypothetical protein
MQSVVNHNSLSQGGLNFAHLTRQIILHQERPASDMEITKNKDPLARLKIFHRFLNPNRRIWFSYWKSQIFGKSLETFGLRIFFLRFLKTHRLV